RRRASRAGDRGAEFGDDAARGAEVGAMIAAIRSEIRERGEYRFGRWGTFGYRFSIAHWRWAVALCKFDGHWALHLFCFWITLWKTRVEPKEIMESWGFGINPRENYVVFNWGDKSKFFYFPWSSEWVKTERMDAAGRFVVTERLSALPRWLGGK